MAAETEVGTAPLTQAELEHFATEGYLLLPSICDAELSALVRADIDAVMDVYDTTQGTSAKGNAPPGPNRRAVVIAEQPHLGALTVYEPIVDRVRQLMEPGGAALVLLPPSTREPPRRRSHLRVLAPRL